MRGERSPDNKPEDSEKEDQWEDVIRLQGQLEEAKANIEQQADLIHEKDLEHDQMIRMMQSDYQREITELKDQIADSEQHKATMQDKLKALEQAKMRILGETEERYQSQIQQLEEELEGIKNTKEAELQAMSQQQEESLNQLKQFYEQEKERLESRFNEERLKTSRRATEQAEESETRFQEDLQEKDEAIDCLQ